MTGPSKPGRLRLMIVDDHPLVRATVGQVIAAPDVEMVAEAATAEEALRIAPQVRPDVLLVDIDLPGMDGIRLARELAPRLPDTRIVMLTASAAERDLVEAMRYGASRYLTEDLAPEALLRAVRSARTGELTMTWSMAGRLVRRLLETGRHAPQSETSSAVASLSAREREVLRLLAEGLTDREIAESLTISPRTVESHASSILRLHLRGPRRLGD